ncbi:FAS1-like dehydratase domain-containing protein [Paracoccus thiocyanatus]|uniref:Acyl-CoA dehydrogenase n=1 Tax=Paracoccus thiocyanatus TaxID=34006 RepID=A0A3D8PFI1_9RHOB|nr:MaoC family dehydratase N-terminal domain-containing protein [Paracoccus thiocyanatus]RDW14021.1 acyl-CoA dehydrogenase [Paracoccus thiocyanatus]
MDQINIAAWKGRTETAEARADAWPVQGLQALLDAPPPDEGTTLPPLAHWCYFTPMVPQARIGSDGHPQRGDFLPPVALPRRMWAGSDMTFARPVPLGARLRKTAEIADISEKQGKTGTMVFVKVRNLYALAQDGAPCLEEMQTLVYRDDPAPDAPKPAPRPAPGGAEWSQPACPDEAMVFRFSAVTFNAHRIHYDYPYATRTEGYEGLVVQGQLLATLMLRAMPALPLGAFSFRAVQPVFVGENIRTEGRLSEDGTAQLWIADKEGKLRMSGEARLA